MAKVPLFIIGMALYTRAMVKIDTLPKVNSRG